MTREEAIGKVRCEISGLPFDKDVREAFETLIPELKESEDERIRRHIAKFIDEQYPTHGSLKEEKDKMLAYLEKQKEHKIAYDKEGYDAALIKSWNASSKIDSIKSAHNKGFMDGYYFGVHEEKPYTWTKHDEAVRKEAIACLKQWESIIPARYYEDYDNILFWLQDELCIHTDVIVEKEKQKEQKPCEDSGAEGDIMQYIEEGKKRGVKEVISFPEKYGLQREQKPVDYEAELKKCKDNPLYFYDKYVSIKQKPAECIDFDNEFKNQVSHLLASVLNKEWEYDKGFVEYAAQQLLEYAKHEIKPAEWGEEDERMRNQLIYDVEHHKKEGLISAKQNKATKALYDGIEKCYDEKIAWLKSLRSKPSLNPSEEEMDALKTVLEHEAERTGSSKELEKANALYERLKKQ